MRFALTGGQESDTPQAIPLLTGIEADAVLADKGYESNQILAFTRSGATTAVIPPKSNRKEPWNMTGNCIGSGISSSKHSTS